MQKSEYESIYKEDLWTRFTIIGLGLWLIGTTLSLSGEGYFIIASDLISGILLVLLGCCALNTSRQSLSWAIAGIGVWLQFAPLLFWAPEAVSYISDTVVGAFVMIMAIVIPKNPEEELLTGEEIPPGWSYNPSSWSQRLPIILLSFLAWMFARYMACYELGYLDTVYDPVFGDGTEKVLTSNISKAFPLADAGLGAMAYTIETLMAAHGGTRRWYTMPWFVLAFSILVIPVGFSSIVLIMLQPIVVGHWCFWCLLTALCMLFMITFAIDEVIATLQHLHLVYKTQRKQFWHIFWHGSHVPEAEKDDRSPELFRNFNSMFQGMFWGITPTWNLTLTLIIGLWLMFSPQMLQITGVIADLDHIFGSLTVAISVIAFAEVVRMLRYINIFFGINVLILALFLSDLAQMSHVIVGILLIVVSFPKGRIKERYGAIPTVFS